MHHAVFYLLADGQRDRAVAVGKHGLRHKHVSIVAIIAVGTQSGTRHLQLAAPRILSAELEVTRPLAVGSPAAKGVKPVGTLGIEANEAYDVVVGPCLEEHVVLRGTCYGQISE